MKRRTAIKGAVVTAAISLGGSIASGEVAFVDPCKGPILPIHAKSVEGLNRLILGYSRKVTAQNYSERFGDPVDESAWLQIEPAARAIDNGALFRWIESEEGERLLELKIGDSQALIKDFAVKEGPRRWVLKRGVFPLDSWIP